MIRMKRWAALLAALACALPMTAGQAQQEQQQQLRPPSVPLVATDPYYSVWSDDDKLTDGATTHWTGKAQPLSSLVRIDGTAYRLIGAEPAATPALAQTNLQVTATRTIYDFEGGGVHVALTFLTPLLSSDLDVMARPVTYLTWTANATDDKNHAVSLFAAPLLLGLLALTAHTHPLAYTGVSLSGGEFGGTKAPLYGKSFTYPTPAEMDYFAGKGVNIIRLPFHWEVLQPKLNAPLDPTEFARFQTVVSTATAKGLTVILDPHNYARYHDKLVGSPDVPDAAFADFWGRLAAPFAQNPRVWFGLMNEPHDMPSPQWLGAANAAIASIRQTGAKNLILVPGNSWTGAHSWVGSGPDANSTVMLGVKDPANHFIYEVHQYLDPNSSGTKPTVVSPTIGVQRLTKFTDWCRAHHAQAFLGEFGAADSPEAAQATENTLAYMEKNRDVWTGFTWWAAGPWWGDYMFTLEPKNGQDRPQMAVLRPHFQANATMPPKK